MVGVNGGPSRTSFLHDAADRQLQQHQANGALTSHTYDAAGRLTVLGSARAGGLLVNRFSYSYDPVGNRTGVVESSGDRTTWSYDRAYQLTHERRSGLTSFDVTHAYDPAGNRACRPTPAAAPPSATTRPTS